MVNIDQRYDEKWVILTWQGRQNRKRMKVPAKAPETLLSGRYFKVRYESFLCQICKGGCQKSDHIIFQLLTLNMRSRDARRGLLCIK